MENIILLSLARRSFSVNLFRNLYLNIKKIVFLCFCLFIYLGIFTGCNSENITHEDISDNVGVTTHFLVQADSVRTNYLRSGVKEITLVGVDSFRKYTQSSSENEHINNNTISQHPEFWKDRNYASRVVKDSEAFLFTGSNSSSIKIVDFVRYKNSTPSSESELTFQIIENNTSRSFPNNQESPDLKTSISNSVEQKPHLIFKSNLPEGTQKWTFNTGGQIVSSPAIGTDGTIYVVVNGSFYAITSNSSGLSSSSWPKFKKNNKNTGN